MSEREKREQILNLFFRPNDLDRVVTIRAYLKELLIQLFTEFDGFSAKRPFGNSDWEYEIVKVLIANNYLKGSINEYDEPEDFDWEEFSDLMKDCIREM